jgi:hypothetical protein
MPIAKKATKADTFLKVMCWGDPGGGKTRLALSFPSPLVIDLERGSRLYADQFEFLVAEPTPALPPHGLVRQVVEELEAGEYPEVRTLVIDPITDYLDALEAQLIKQEERNGVNLAALKGPQKAQVYARIKDGIRERLNKLLQLPVHIVFVARAKNQWAQEEGKMQVVGRTADANEIVDYLCDIVIHLQKGGTGVVRKSRLAELPDAIKAVSYADIAKALGEAPAILKPAGKAATKAAPTADEVANAAAAGIAKGA